MIKCNTPKFSVGALFFEQDRTAVSTVLYSTVRLTRASNATDTLTDTFTDTLTDTFTDTLTDTLVATPLITVLLHNPIGLLI